LLSRAHNTHAQARRNPKALQIKEKASVEHPVFTKKAGIAAGLSAFFITSA